MDTHRTWLLCAAAAALFLATAHGCGPAHPPSPPPAATSAPAASGSAAPFDVCAASKPAAHPYAGILRNARCDQDLYISMANMEGELGVECMYCHAPMAGVPDTEDYPPMTPKKEIANWMSTHLMQAVKPADGSPMRCKSCHTDENGKPVARILGVPRDTVKANEWMALVMVKKFVAADGSRLKCKSCHVGGPGSEAFQTKVIGKTDQLPKHAAGVQGTPAF